MDHYNMMNSSYLQNNYSVCIALVTNNLVFSDASKKGSMSQTDY